MERLSSSSQLKADSAQRQTEISLAGEQLRLRLHNAKLIKDRRRHMFTYPNCFVAKELIDWLIEHKESPNRETAINIMQKFLDSRVVHHASNEFLVFKDAQLYYRFRNDDGTLTPSEQIKIAVRSQRLYEMMVSEEDSILQVREEGSVRYRRTFLGSKLLDWLVTHGEVSSRHYGVQLCRAMLQHGIIQHVTREHHFSDSDLLFRFTINFQRRRKLIEVLDDSSPSDPRAESPDSPFCLRKLSSELPRSGFVCVLKRPVTVEELLAEGAPYDKKTLRIIGDAVGWGFVARGTGPCHIQTVDPNGPAAASGMKIRQFIKTVNGINCLHLDYITIYRHVVAGPRKLIMEVFEPIDA